jgi:hypothetical protein
MPDDRPARSAWPLIVPLVLVAALLVVAWRARHSLQHEPAFTVDPSRWQLAGRPAWMPEDVAADVAASVSTHVAGGASLLREDDLQRLSEAVSAASPWIAAVERIEPRWPAQAELRLRVHRPVLAVDGDILLAADGRVLGLGRVDLEPGPLAYRGDDLDADVVECAAAAAEVLPFRGPLLDLGVRLDAVKLLDDGTVAFVTDGEVELSWGRSRRRSRLAYLDLPAAARIENLRQVLADFPGLAGVGRVRLWTDRPEVTRRDA